MKRRSKTKNSSTIASDSQNGASNVSKRNNTSENQNDNITSNSWDLGFQFDEDLTAVPCGKINKFNEDPVG